MRCGTNRAFYMIQNMLYPYEIFAAKWTSSDFKIFNGSCSIIWYPGCIKSSISHLHQILAHPEIDIWNIHDWNRNWYRLHLCFIIGFLCRRYKIHYYMHVKLLILCLMNFIADQKGKSLRSSRKTFSFPTTYSNTIFPLKYFRNKERFWSISKQVNNLDNVSFSLLKPLKTFRFRAKIWLISNKQDSWFVVKMAFPTEIFFLQTRFALSFVHKRGGGFELLLLRNVKAELI